MPKNIEAELDDFIRWLATMPQHLADFKQNPEAVMRNSRLSDAAQDTLRSQGTYATVLQARHKLEEILTSPESQKESDFSRDRSVGGFGGKVLRKEPKPGE